MMKPPPDVQTTEHKRPRRNVRVDLLEQDYHTMRSIAKRQGWTMNYTIRRAINRFASLYRAGADIGVVTVPLDMDDEPGSAEKRNVG